MTDLSALSTEELIAIAGPPSTPVPDGTTDLGVIGLSDRELPADLSSLSNEELMQIAGPPTPMPLSTDEINPMMAGESGGSAIDYIQGGLKGIAKAGLDVVTAPADLLYRGGIGAANLLGANINPEGGYPSDRVNQALEVISGGTGDQTAEKVAHIGGNLASIFAIPSMAKSIAAKVPIGPSIFKTAIGYGTEGAAISALADPKSENLPATMAEGAALNIAVPAVVKLTGNLARGLLNTSTEAARKLELSAYGGMKGNIARAYERSPEILDEMGKRENPINLAINAFKRDGGGKGSMEGEILLKELRAQSSKYASQLGEELGKATQQQKNVIVPQFTFTQKYIDQLPGAAKADAQAMAEDLISKTVNNTDGSLLSLQAEKTALTPLIKESAYGTAANPTKTELLKRIKGDLRRTIEEGYESITGKSGARIKSLNQEIAHRETLEPLFENLRNSSEARDVLRAGIKSLSTTGGVGQTALAAIIGGGAGGPPLAGAAVLGNMYLQTPQGKRALANGLRSSFVQAPLQGTIQGAKLADPLGKAAVVLAGTTLDRKEYSKSDPLQSESQRPAIKRQTQLPDRGYSKSQNSPRNSAPSGSPNQKTPYKPISLDITAPDPISLALDKMRSTSMEMADTSPEFQAKVYQIADDLGADPDHLLQIMNFETGGTLSPSQKNNAGSGATGLIQFMPATAKQLTGADTKAAAIKILSEMSPVEQLDYVKKYLMPFKGKLDTLEDVYMAVLWPKAVGKDSDYALFKKGTTAYWQNRGLDIDKDGIVTKAEATQKVEMYEA